MSKEEMDVLNQGSKQAKLLIHEKQFDRLKELVCTTMHDYPDSPQPHNWLGIFLEMTGNHIQAMKHFRAAWSLDPTYLPVRFNLKRYSDFHPSGIIAFEEEDCLETKAEDRYQTIYDDKGIGHMVRRER